ncbi:MAG: hypothetical protein EKK40_15485 [Bradyrhizobiaceae bacterium]|nr:MAG: hypothetical protein EKK40_15485 [Bradyrhizobiaceae bacterium]
MTKFLMAGACAIAVSAMAMSPSFAKDQEKSGMKSETHQTTGSNSSVKEPSNAATTGSSMDAKRGIPGNNAVGGDGSMSDPKSTAPGASKAGGG